MPIAPIAPMNTAGTTGAYGSTPEPSPAPASNAMLDREAFLKLLVAQLRYQDPSKPIDSSEMIAQSAQLTVVDKLTEISASLERSSSAQRLSLAGSIMGKRISFAGPDGYPIVATVDYVRFDNGSIILGAGDYDVPYEAVMAVADPPSTTAPPATAPPSTDPPTTDPPTTDPPTDPTDTQESES